MTESTAPVLNTYQLLPDISSEKNNQLKGQGTMPIIEASTIKTEQDPNVSSVQAKAYKYSGIQQPNLSSKYEPLSMDDGNDHHATSSRSMQMPFYHDLPYAVAFLLHFAVVLFLAICFGSFDFDQDEGNADANAPMKSKPDSSSIVPIIIAALTSIMIPFVSIGSFIPRYAKASVLVSLHVSVLSFFLVMMMMFFFLQNIPLGGILLLPFLAILALGSLQVSVLFFLVMMMFSFIPASIWIVSVAAYLFRYIRAMKEYVPYAAAMLKIATTGVA